MWKQKYLAALPPRFYEFMKETISVYFDAYGYGDIYSLVTT